MVSLAQLLEYQMKLCVDGVAAELQIIFESCIRSRHTGHLLRSLTVSFTVPAHMRRDVIVLRDAASADPIPRSGDHGHTAWFAINEPIHLVDGEGNVSSWRLLSNGESWEAGEETARFEWDLEELEELQWTPHQPDP